MPTQRKPGLLAILAVSAAACSNGSDLSPGVSASDTATATGTTTGEPATTGSSTTFDTLDSAEGSGGTEGFGAEIDCADPPGGAIGADYEHQLQLVDDMGVSWNWEVSGLPDGITVNPINGLLTGAPSEAGDYEIDVTVTHPNGNGTGTCTVTVGPELSVDFDAVGGPCITPDDDLNDFILGGDGSPLTCTTPGGSGEGRIPDGIDVNVDTCATQGTTDDTYGTWVWMTQVEQSGLRVPVPYCYTIEDQAPGAYTITADHSGGMGNHLEPAVRTFAPGEPISFGGDGDPFFSVTQETPLSPLNFHFSFNVAASPFGDCQLSECFGLSPTSVAVNMADERIGFTHEMFAHGIAVREEFEDRTWVLSVRTFYCLADNNVDCNDDNYLANGNGELRFGVIMIPEAG